MLSRSYAARGAQRWHSRAARVVYTALWISVYSSAFNCTMSRGPQPPPSTSVLAPLHALDSKRNVLPLCAPQGSPTGRLLRYDPATRETVVLGDGIWFANGVALSQDGDYVAVRSQSNSSLGPSDPCVQSRCPCVALPRDSRLV